MLANWSLTFKSLFWILPFPLLSLFAIRRTLISFDYKHWTGKQSLLHSIIYYLKHTYSTYNAITTKIIRDYRSRCRYLYSYSTTCRPCIGKFYLSCAFNPVQFRSQVGSQVETNKLPFSRFIDQSRSWRQILEVEFTGMVDNRLYSVYMVRSGCFAFWFPNFSNRNVIDS